MTRPSIALIAIGTVIKEFEDGPDNGNQAWDFYSTELGKHENPVAIVIGNDQCEYFGEIWSRNDVPASYQNFHTRMSFLGVYGDYDD
ncbi:hypothetical protein FAZ69_09415 [Trinickia terrae]|uniref:Uncharacterized protein n=1 Tax=Trinickia terrae TaxID=2571161 RepID=A0A4U1I705_9BURK|nr:hypothetical protein [Trinickia terrae]TKC89181.1 hypothetical protein FAZ69_09415 [Trinickia terrae]